MNASEVLLDHALSLEWDAMPADARHAVRTLFHDTLCVGAAGAAASGAAAVASAAGGWGEGGRCRVLGRAGLRLPPTQAAFVNAFQIHAQEFDAVHEGAVLHPFSASVAALLAEIDRGGPYRGADVLAALAAGVDVATGLGVAATSPLRFFRPATAGIFGAVAAVARLRRLSRTEAGHAFGYALAFASGSMQAHVEGSVALPIQVANAARGAIAAIDIAAAGLHGPAHAVDGPFGYFAQFETTHDAPAMLADLGRVFRVTECSAKPFPTGRAAHGGIVAAQIMMQTHALDASLLARFTYSAPPLIKRLVGRPATPGMTVAYARLCLPWLVATTFDTGGVGLGDFSADRLLDPRLHALAAKISVEDDGTENGAAFTPAVATAELGDGRKISVTLTDLPGAPGQPLSHAAHLAKALACLSFVGLGAAHLRVNEAMAGLEFSADVRDLLSLIYADGVAPS